MTKETRKNKDLERQAIDFLHFVFNQGIALYESQGALNEIFSVPSKKGNIGTKNQEYYKNIRYMAPGIRRHINSKECDLLRNWSTHVASKGANIELLSNMFFNVLNRYRIYQE